MLLYALWQLKYRGTETGGFAAAMANMEGFKSRSATVSLAAIVVVVLGCAVAHVSAQASGLRVGFYSRSCAQAETIIKSAVAARFKIDKAITHLLRMFFHDCFVKGCDASILLDKTTKNQLVEKDAVPNQTVQGFEFIDQVKAMLERTCPRTVSCADIIALATRDAVVAAGGQTFNMSTGRRDGKVSDINNGDLPGPSITVSDAAAAFSGFGLTLNDMVTLLGAHMVGSAHCSFFRDRAWDFQGTGQPDSSMDPSMASRLRRICPNPDTDTSNTPLTKEHFVPLDQNTTSTLVFDNSLYKQLQLKKGILQIDQELFFDRSSSALINAYAADNHRFSTAFGATMVKLGRIGVLTGRNGEIHTNCCRVNGR